MIGIGRRCSSDTPGPQRTTKSLAWRRKSGTRQAEDVLAVVYASRSCGPSQHGRRQCGGMSGFGEAPLWNGKRHRNRRDSDMRQSVTTRSGTPCQRETLIKRGDRRGRLRAAKRAAERGSQPSGSPKLTEQAPRSEIATRSPRKKGDTRH